MLQKVRIVSGILTDSNEFDIETVRLRSNTSRLRKDVAVQGINVSVLIDGDTGHGEEGSYFASVPSESRTISSCLYRCKYHPGRVRASSKVPASVHRRQRGRIFSTHCVSPTPGYVLDRDGSCFSGIRDAHSGFHLVSG